ncbi:ferritin-like domain-containing protein [Paenibacillus sp. KQZ6P-2]|uniref:Ferritin-like domain-containing protein n=1 Tax=Paenibacillus mangrovi TaxID=2931978 RepID=A0A9X1WSR1_9BACL|nr:ferritin-like domain-containing protein [Paenibacillus mangrovi]MCJ8014394.1 ferritin-like domain-containing protein [Paenibacillus mangrovi]
MNYRDNGSGSIAVQDLQYVIQAEYRSMIYAQRLLFLAPPEHQMHFSRYVETKQKERLVVWTRLYYHLTACYPVFSKVKPPRDYVSGLKTAIEDTLDTADFYAWLHDSSQDPYLRNILQRAMNGETRWAVRQQFLYSSYLLENGDKVKGKGFTDVTKKQLPPV